MFDVGFWELALLALVGLLVVGPERLPKLARTVGLWVGKGRGFLSSVKADIERELKAEELKKILQDQQDSNPLEEIIDQTSRSLRGIEKDAGEAVASARKDYEAKKPDPVESNSAKKADDD